uniref:Ig-like domain-containing protein n=1 Tax=Ursus americanus TaxID=9643 RepID=A0A452QIR0_URSAM
MARHLSLHIADTQPEDSAVYSLRGKHTLLPDTCCLVSSFSSGQTHGDSVTQTEGQLTLSEKASLTINCTFSTTWSPTLFWYVQYLGEGLQLLLKAVKEKEKGINKGFEATYDKDSKSFHLEKGSVQASDSAVYYCAMNDTVMGTAGGAERKL